MAIYKSEREGERAVDKKNVGKQLPARTCFKCVRRRNFHQPENEKKVRSDFFHAICIR